MALVSRHLGGNLWGVRGEICCACTAGNKNAVHSIAVHSNDSPLQSIAVHSNFILISMCIFEHIAQFYFDLNFICLLKPDGFVVAIKEFIPFGVSSFSLL